MIKLFSLQYITFIAIRVLFQKFNSKNGDLQKQTHQTIFLFSLL